MSWSLAWTSRSLEDLRKLDDQTRARVLAALERYAESGQGDVRQLRAIAPPEYRLRVGDWRVRFQRDLRQLTLVILRVLHREKAY